MKPGSTIAKGRSSSPVTAVFVVFFKYSTDTLLLGVSSETPLLEIVRLALGHRGELIEWGMSRCDCRHYYYHNELD